MTLDWLKEPISADAPCGPDLSANDDAAFLDYFYDAEGRMPERYFTPGVKADGADFVPGTVFDPKSIVIARERDTILALLKRSRDLRLLSLLARFQMLAGRLDGFVEAVEAAADVLDAFPAEVHPRDSQERRGTIEELASQGVVISPLQYYPIDGLGEATLRRFIAASGQSTPRAGEVGLTPDMVIGAIAAPGNRAAVARNHALLSAAAAATSRIMAACQHSPDRPFTPSLHPVLQAIAEMQGLIRQGCNDLLPWADSDAGDAPRDAAQQDDAPVAGAVAGAAPAAATALPPLPRTTIPDRPTAEVTLRAVESWFARHEPSSAALLLITQARLLLGKTLVEAIEQLLPEAAPRTAITFGPGNAFVMNMERLQMLSKVARQEADTAPAPLPAPPEIADRRAAAANLAGVEEYFRAREPASPIPMLLALARTYLDRDFAAIVSAFVPPAAS